MSDELLNTILAEVLAMRKDFARYVEEQRGHGSVGNTHHALLLAVIAREFDYGIFTKKELIERANWGGSGPLVLALADASVRNARSLGKLLTKLQKLNLPGLYVERVGHQSLGILWAVRRRS
jgi:hypothetical protein